MIKELNDNIAAASPESKRRTAAAVGGSGGGGGGVRTAVRPPTRAALRQHDAMQRERLEAGDDNQRGESLEAGDDNQRGESVEAAVEAAAVLAQLPALARQGGHWRRERGHIKEVAVERPQGEQHETPRSTGGSERDIVSPHTSENARRAPAAAFRCGTPIRRPASVS